jgi:excisionase family DNA binding protein
MPQTDETLLTPAEAAAVLRCSVRTLRRLRRRGALTDVWVARRRVRISRAAIDDFIERGGVVREVAR